MKRSLISVVLFLGMLALVILAGPTWALSWRIETVDIGEYVGLTSSLALDSGGRPHISYEGSSPYHLKYAHWNDSVWVTETVDNDVRAGSPALALDGSGWPHISYHDFDTRTLKYARWNGSAWVISTVDSDWAVGAYSSLALDSSGRPHISYFDYNHEDLKYAHWNGGRWQIETVDDAGSVGSFTSLALDGSGRPHISYHGNDHLKYARWNGSRWQITVVDNDGSVGRDTSLALDGSEHSHISYQDFSHNDLKYAYWDGRDWRIEVVDSNGFVGSGTSLVLDGSGRVHISYYDESNHKLKVAHQDGSGWQFHIVDSVGMGGARTSLALDTNGWLHISYHNENDGELKYALGSFNTPPVANAGGPYGVGEGGSVQLDASASTDAEQDAATLSYAWEFDGDNQYDDATGVKVSFSAVGLDGPGTVTVGLQVTDAGGLVATTTATITVQNIAPVVNAGADQTVYQKQTVNLKGTWTDPAGSLDNLYSWQWDLNGDDTPDSNGSAVYGSAASATTSFADEGSYALTFTVTDKDGGRGSDSVVITVLKGYELYLPLIGWVFR